jgi:LmbE family N-acetylglucosaminyl deacetylase
MSSCFAGSLAMTLAVVAQAHAAQVPPGPEGVAASAASAKTHYESDPYEFAAASSVAFNLRLTRTANGVSFSWPRAATQWDTALLSVRLRGAGRDSWIEVSSGEFRAEQYLDPGATGVRWLNLSGLRAQLIAGGEVTLHTHGVILEPGGATLRLFDSHLDLQQRILVLAPHPDDAEIAAFGLYADRQASVVTVTAGNAGDMNYSANINDPAEHYALKGYLRAVDSVTVPWQGNIPPERTANLGYFDGRLDAMYLAPAQAIPEVYSANTDVAPYRRANLSTLVSGGSRSNTWQHLVDDLVEVLRKVNPGIVVMPDPRLDTHLDHEFASVAIDQALERWQGNPVFLLYTNHSDGNHYPYGPAGTVVSLPPGEQRLRMQKIYSHPVAHDLQIRKLFALESMHDLRLSPDEQITCGSATAAHRPDYPRAPEEDYFRRAPRANELFYVFDKTGARAAIQDFLVHYAAAQDTRSTPAQ